MKIRHRGKGSEWIFCASHCRWASCNIIRSGCANLYKSYLATEVDAQTFRFRSFGHKQSMGTGIGLIQCLTIIQRKNHRLLGSDVHSTSEVILKPSAMMFQRVGHLFCSTFVWLYQILLYINGGLCRFGSITYF